MGGVGRVGYKSKTGGLAPQLEQSKEERKDVTTGRYYSNRSELNLG